jgi:hypothetical protein
MGNNITAFDPATGAGTYTITYTYTDSNGCTASASDDFTVILCLLSVSLLPSLRFVLETARSSQPVGQARISGQQEKQLPPSPFILLFRHL